MKKNMRSLRRNQLDYFFEQSKSALKAKSPKQGWIKEIRESLGMSMQDLGARMGVIKQRVERLEKDEVLGRVTLETMKKTADALDCEFVYFIVPKGSLNESLKSQAHIVAMEVLKATDLTMKLENQKVSKKILEEMIVPIEEQLIRDNDRRIWKTK